MFAMLFAITSTLVCCAVIPVAAIASALTCVSSDRHSAELEIRGHDLVTDGDGALQRLLGRHHGLDHLLHGCLAADAGGGNELRVLDAPQSGRGKRDKQSTEV